MNLVGYTDRMSVAAGQTIQFMVSSVHPSYRVDLVRLIHGDTDDRGPGFKEVEVASTIGGEYPGRVQEIATGSCVAVPDDPRLQLVRGFTIQAWIWPTTPGRGLQGLVTKWSPHDKSGYGLVIDAAGKTTLWVGDGQGAVDQLVADRPLQPHSWYFIAGTLDPATGIARLVQSAVTPWGVDLAGAIQEKPIHGQIGETAGVPLLMGAGWQVAPARFEAHLNGKIDRPRIFEQPLTVTELTRLANGEDLTRLGKSLVVAWDYGAETGSARVTDQSANQLHGVAINMPTRAVTGANWSGRETNFAHAPSEYGAIHFHDDDLEDARWEPDFALMTPDDLPSGVYAARLRAATDEEYLPFVVRPKSGSAAAPIAYLFPTLTHLAYASEHMPIDPPELFPFYREHANAREYAYVASHKLNSLYDHHTDGSGVCYASWHRPLVNVRPKQVFRGFDAAEHFSADLYLIDWMERKGFAYEVIADENLHDEGVALLEPYNVVVTGTHPEYWTEAMLDALQAYLANGGRVMYLGGNGFYWVTAFDPERPHVIEVRRWAGTGTWAAKPGEYYLSSTGELGGLWRNRGRAPQRLLGVGFTSQGFDFSRPYHRLSDSFDPRAAFIFEGIEANEVIGDFPSLSLRYGAAGYEIDRLDYALGTPLHALQLASATGFSDSYQHVIEECLAMDNRQGGSHQPLVRADLVYFETPKGGGVFTSGSIAWCGALSYNNYINNVSRLTENVLRRFAGDEPLPPPPG